MEEQLSIFDFNIGLTPLKVDKPLRLIELFAGQVLMEIFKNFFTTSP